MSDADRPSVFGGMRRRDFLAATGVAAVSAARADDRPGPGAAAKPAASPPAGYNILFLLCDQERHFDAWPFPVPGRERIRRSGVTFARHEIAANICSPSRGVIYTGRHLQHTRMFDNAGSEWQPDLSPDVPTVGDMLRDAGYYTAYKGKWHLNHETATHDPRNVDRVRLLLNLKEYGFDDYLGVGDLVGETLGGYRYDELIAASAVNWLRATGQGLADRNKPWFLAVNLVNPHDVMFIDTNEPGKPGVQRPGKFPVNRPPNHAVYKAAWDVPLPATRDQGFDAPGRPPAHREYQKALAALVGTWPPEDRRWKVLQDYYFNCIRDADRHVFTILDELDALGLTDRTIVVFTSDHGELGGAHQMYGKGACAYREQNHVPLTVVHPAYPGGKTCPALTSHLDLAPTLVALTGAPADARTRIAKHLKGRDLTPLLAAPEVASVDAAREGALFNYNMFLYLDAKWAGQIAAIEELKLPPEEALRRERQIPIDFSKRGAIRSVFDGRYRFSRYFSPLRFNRPTTMEAIFADNDVELFDTKADPNERVNLADDRRANGDLLLAMNDKLNRLIEAEVGADDGSFLPLDHKGGWGLRFIDT